MTTAVSIALCSAPYGASAQSVPLTSEQFIKDAIQANLAEVELGQLAQKKGTARDVRELGIRLAIDHQSANENAIKTAQHLNVTPPGKPDARDKATYDKLARLSGEQFDRAFIQAELKDHIHDIALYNYEARRGRGPAEAYAAETLYELQEHLQMAQQAERNWHLAGAESNDEPPGAGTAE
jgi:putative membrane protein